MNSRAARIDKEEDLLYDYSGGGVGGIGLGGIGNLVKYEEPSWEF